MEEEQRMTKLDFGHLTIHFRIAERPILPVFSEATAVLQHHHRPEVSTFGTS
jgi:hypothetical protein